jgi:hypothetical protein
MAFGWIVQGEFRNCFFGHAEDQMWELACLRWRSVRQSNSSRHTAFAGKPAPTGTVYVRYDGISGRSRSTSFR